MKNYIIILSILSCGCATKTQVMTSYERNTAPPKPVTYTLNAVAPQPKGDKLTFAWDGNAGMYRLYRSDNKTNWIVAGETINKTITITNLFSPQWFVVTAKEGEEESAYSNMVGWLGNQTIVTVKEWESADLINKLILKTTMFTNVIGQKYFGHQIEQQTTKIIEQ